MTSASWAISAVAALVVALLFSRHWRRSGDPFFACFAAAFLLIGASSMILLTAPTAAEREPVAYVVRLAGFTGIILAIVYKNWPLHDRARRRRDSAENDQR